MSVRFSGTNFLNMGYLPPSLVKPEDGELKVLSREIIALDTGAGKKGKDRFLAQAALEKLGDYNRQGFDMQLADLYSYSSIGLADMTPEEIKSHTDAFQRWQC